MPRVSDQMGNILSIDSPPQRIISLVPSQTELLHHWGLGKRVVGITKFCVHPHSWYKSKARIGGTKTINHEKIAALKPDLIIGNKEENSQKDIEKLQEDYPVWMSDLVTFEEIWDMMQRLGQVLEMQQQAQQLITQLQGMFTQLDSKVNEWDSLKVAYFIWNDPLMVAANNTFIHTMLSRAGFRNIFSHLDRYPAISPQQLEQIDIDLLMLSSEPFPFKEKHVADFQSLCPNTKIEIVDGEIFSWYGSRLLQTTDYIKQLRQRIHANR